MNRLVATALLSIVIWLPHVPASAQPATYGDAMTWYEREAARGSAKAQFLLGLLYERGAGPRGKDAKRAYDSFLKAAEQGHPQAQFKVAAALQFGRGVPKNPKLAYAWYRRAAGFGVAEAQYNLGLMLLNGEGTAASPQQAARSYGEAARNGFGPAQLALGYLYLNGTGVKKDPADAWAWFRAAESRGIGGAEAARRAVEASLSPAHIERARRLAATRLKK